MTIVVGAGPTGLALAWKLKRQGKEVMLFEASGRAGGNIRSEWNNGHLLEFGPNSLRMSDPLHEFLLELGLEKEILPASKRANKRFVMMQGKYQALPSGPLSFLFGSFFPWHAKMQVLRERNLKSKGAPHESADAFIRRRFGDFVADNLLAPFVSGIYAGDSRQLVAEKAFPQLVEGERKHDSVIRGMFKLPKSKHKGIFSFPNGLQTLTDRMAADLGEHLQLNSPLKAIRKTCDEWELHFGARAIRCAKVVLCLPAHALAHAMETLDPEFAALLGKVNYPPVALIHSLYNNQSLSKPLVGFGSLNPPSSEAFGLGVIFSSSVFPSRSREGQTLVTTMVGGSVHPDRALLPDAEILKGVANDHRKFLGINGNPEMERVTAYSHAIPQYDAHVLGLEEMAGNWAEQGLFFGGNWSRGVSVPDCIQNARRLCEQLQAAQP